jgi:dihydroorotate dehydrogenase
MVQIDSGLIFTGPGLPKRCNDALLCWRKSRGQSRVSSATQGDRGALSPGTLDTVHQALDSRPSRQAWLWTLLMGIAMLVGGVMAMVIAVTRVVMPYDEQFVGMTRAELAQVNDNLLPFMTHDRVTLAGTMLAVGILYSVLSWCGIRRGWHWAHSAVIASAFVGFVTFFGFLGFGYFDPLHAFVTVVLFQFLLLGVHSDRSRPAYDDVPNLTNHTAWRASLWGQLVYVIHGVLLIVAGGVITTYGMTSVFVPEDLEFMQTTAEVLCSANPRLLPLVAHDRATFGGMLVACGITVLLSAMWGYRQGSAWLWWALFAGGNIAYIATILVHWGVGYTDLKHLLPAYGGLLLTWVGSTLSRGFLCGTDGSDQANWRTLAGESFQ